MLNWLDAKKRAGLIGPDANKKNRDGQASVGRVRGGGGGGGTISAEGGQYLLADYVRGGQFPLADYVRGDKISGGTESAPTPAQLEQHLKVCILHDAVVRFINIK